jgi:2-methylcitrate dehydratase PrpD
LRDRVIAVVDPALAEDAARVRIRLKGGRIVERFVAHALGSLARPMTDRDLENKFRTLCAHVLTEDTIDAVLAACWRLEQSADVGALARLTAPQRQDASAVA